MIWFIAELLIEMRIEKEPRNVVHVNSHLIRAKTNADAKRKAKEIGKQSSNSYKNTDGKNIKVRFRGIRDLFELPEGIEDGAEILWEEHIGLTESKIKSWLRPTSKKSKSRCNIPNYMPESVMKDLEKAGFGRKELMHR
jgi:hypothetical protein